MFHTLFIPFKILFSFLLNTVIYNASYPISFIHFLLSFTKFAWDWVGLTHTPTHTTTETQVG